MNDTIRGGSKKFYVYVRDPQSKNIKKVSFGAEGGGGSLKVKFNDPQKRKNFASRHDCAKRGRRQLTFTFICIIQHGDRLIECRWLGIFLAGSGVGVDRHPCVH